jgi:aminotransferase
VYIELDGKKGFKLTPRDIEKACSSKPKAIILNYPTNPTGVSYTKKELQELAGVIKKHNLIVISDEIYDELTYDFNHTPFAALTGMRERTIYLNGFSKAYAMTGWRIGYACGSENFISNMTKVHQYSMLCAPIMSQMAACEALEGPQRNLVDMIKEYNRRREFITEGLNNIGLRCLRPQGAFYIFPSIKNTGYNSLDFANELLRKEKVAVVPGTAFGKNGEGYIRISYATSLDNLKEALKRMKSFLKR